MICQCCGKSFTPKASRHRVLSGDATVQADVERLMGPEKADMVFLDSPYNGAVHGYIRWAYTKKPSSITSFTRWGS
jgi:DNA modification methylase